MDYNPGFRRWLLMQSSAEKLQCIIELKQLNREFAHTFRFVAERDAIELHWRARFECRCLNKNRQLATNRLEPNLKTDFLSDISFQHRHSRSRNPTRVDQIIEITIELSQEPSRKRIVPVVSYNKTLKIWIRIQFES